MTNFNIQIEQNNVIKFNNENNDVKFNVVLQQNKEKVEFVNADHNLVSTFDNIEKQPPFIVKIGSSLFFIDSVDNEFNRDTKEKLTTLNLVKIK